MFKRVGMVSPADALPLVRHDSERGDPHPVYAAMMRHRVSRTFAKPGIRDSVMVGYMGLVKQIDDQRIEYLYPKQIDQALLKAPKQGDWARDDVYAMIGRWKKAIPAESAAEAKLWRRSCIRRSGQPASLRMRSQIF